jgi:SanA protein
VLPSGQLSPVLRWRADAAIDLYKAQKVSKILVSGDNGTRRYNEVDPTYDYLIQNGVADEDIFLDYAGFDTYSTMYRAKDIFVVDSVIISTQSFHLPRSVFIARALGLRAYGIRADVGPLLFKNYVRETLAKEKAVIDLAFRRKPKYLGEQIPIAGNGSAYRQQKPGGALKTGRLLCKYEKGQK